MGQGRIDSEGAGRDQSEARDFSQPSQAAEAVLAPESNSISSSSSGARSEAEDIHAQALSSKRAAGEEAVAWEVGQSVPIFVSMAEAIGRVRKCLCQIIHVFWSGPFRILPAVLRLGPELLDPPNFQLGVLLAYLHNIGPVAF